MAPNFVCDNVRLLRRHKREPVNIRAVVYCGIACRSATIYDISDGGVGLEGAGALFPGSEVKPCGQEEAKAPA